MYVVKSSYREGNLPQKQKKYCYWVCAVVCKCTSVLYSPDYPFEVSKKPSKFTTDVRVISVVPTVSV